MKKNVLELAESTFSCMAAVGFRTYLVCSEILLFLILVKITDSLFSPSVCQLLICCTAAALLMFVLGLFGLFAMDKFGQTETAQTGEDKRKEGR